MSSIVTRSRVNDTAHPSTKTGSPAFTGGNGYPVSASTSPDAAKRMPPGPGSAGGVNEQRPPSATVQPALVWTTMGPWLCPLLEHAEHAMATATAAEPTRPAERTERTQSMVVSLPAHERRRKKRMGPK